MKKILGFAVLAIAVAAPAAVQAQGKETGNWLVRLRAAHLDSANKDSTGLGLTVNNKTIPDINITYFYTPNFAVELVLTVPQKHTVNSTVVGGDIGSFKHLPPTLSAQYHFTNLGGFRPYVGAGLNYTNLSDVKILNGAVNLKRNSYGLAIGAGVDVPLSGGWVLNLDVKKINIGTNVYLSGADKGKFKVDPTLVGIGAGLRF